MEGTANKSKQEKYIKKMLQVGCEMNAPVFGVFELTGRCNFNCKMCYVHTMDQKRALKNELTTEQWLTILDEAFKEGLMFAVLTGGECLLREDFKELYLHLWNKGVIISINTNGYFVDASYVDFFKKYPPRRIQISLYGTNDDEYYEITGRRAFDRVAATLKSLHEAGINIKVAVTPCKQSLGFCSKIMQYAYNSGYEFGLGELILSPHAGIERDDYSITAEEIVELLCERERICGKELTPIPREKLPKPGQSLEIREPEKYRCYAGKCRYCITWRGKMVPCVAIESIEAAPLNVGFIAAWKEISYKMGQVTMPEKCLHCDYRAVCSPCPIARHKDLETNESNPMQCKLIMLKCEKGISTVHTT